MRISLNWLRDYLDIRPDVDIKDIADSLTLAGLEVEGVQSLKEKSEKILLGEVSDCYPDGDNEWAYDVMHDGKKIVVNGPKSSIAKGMWVAFLPGTIKKRGRLASFADVGLELGPHDLIYFASDQFAGSAAATLADVKDFDDVIFTLGITPNRADALSHLGVSRELSALLDLNARSPMLSPREMAGPTHEKIAIEIDNAEDCPRYACRVIENVVIAESPYWMKLRLLAAGLRPINNVVDITNYVMLSRGQPLHAFDYDKLHIENARVKIIVERARQGEKWKSLDGQEITLSSDDVVISDKEKVLALAGVIGGESSAVTSDTKTVLLEAAYFNPKNVRLSARRYNISTESSYRFERGTDPNAVLDGLNFAARLLSETSDAKVSREPIDAYRKRIDPQEIKMRPERAQAVLGMDAESLDQDLLRKRFLRLGIETIAKRGDAIYFRVPTYRSDLLREIDLIEEAARMIGYDKVKSRPVGPHEQAMDFGYEKMADVSARLRARLISRGFFEAVNYAFLNNEFQRTFFKGEDKDAIEVKNPLSDRYGVMRQSLVPGLIKNLLHNQRNQEKSIQLFEIGTIFLGKRENGQKPNPQLLHGSLDQDSYGVEKQRLAGVAFGRSSYYAFDKPAQQIDFFSLKGALSELFSSLGFHDAYPRQTIKYTHGAPLDYLHPGEASTITYQENDQATPEVMGHFGRLHPQIANALEIVGDVFVFELDLDRLATLLMSVPKYRAFSRYPTIERDVAFLAQEDVNVGDILHAIETVEGAKENLVNLRVFDVYRGKNIEDGKKSIALSLLLQRDDRTLTDDEAEEFMNRLIDKVKNETGCTIR